MRCCKLLILRGLSEHKQSTTGAFDVFRPSVSLLQRVFNCTDFAYKVDVQAGDQELTDTDTATLGGNTELKVVRRGQQFVIERDTDHTDAAPQTTASAKGKS